ncbi:hypothetical protein AAC387_Pa10g2038 [Persea americana]
MMPLWRKTMLHLSEAQTWTIHYCKRTANRAAVPDMPPSSPSLPPDIRFIVNEEKQRASAYTRAFYFPHSVAQDASSSTVRHQEASTSAGTRERWVVTTSEPQE